MNELGLKYCMNIALKYKKDKFNAVDNLTEFRSKHLYKQMSYLSSWTYAKIDPINQAKNDKI